MVPSASLALAVMFKVLPAASVSPFAGAVIATTGDVLSELATVIGTATDVVVVAAESVALAVRE